MLNINKAISFSSRLTHLYHIMVATYSMQAQHASCIAGAEMPRIAIIGGGIGGSTTAYKLSQLFGSSLSTIDVYEGNQIGGRLKTIDINGVDYEAGGAILHPSNEHMVNFCTQLGIETKPSPIGNFAMFKEGKTIFETSKNSWVEAAQFMWRYGRSLFKMSKSIDRFTTDFLRIYKWQEEHQSFTTVPNLILSMSDELMNATQISLRHFLSTEGFSEQFTDELALLATRARYGQTPDNLDAFIGSVSLTGAQPGLWAVKGGNHKVPDGLLKESGAKIIKQMVTKVTNATTDPQKPLYRLETADGSSSDYNVVVLAFPFVEGPKSPQFVDFDTDFTKLNREFHHLAVQFVEGVPNYEYFGYENVEQMPSAIFPLDKSNFFNSLDEIHPASGQKTSQRVYKVVSEAVLTQDQLDTLFQTRRTTRVVTWLGYPLYRSKMEFKPFVVAPRMYYANAIDLTGSAMEMSALAGVNIANLIRNQWMGHDHLVDNMFVIGEKQRKIEL